ncbi:hypothetical protein KJ909_03490 [Patescibacteria group bacterium]|nr:hypothetical protein [Patescibacteria group bacterium]
MPSVKEIREITILGRTTTKTRQYLPGESFHLQGTHDFLSGLSESSDLVLTPKGNIILRETVTGEDTGLLLRRKERVSLPPDRKFKILGFTVRTSWHLVS